MEKFEILSLNNQAIIRYYQKYGRGIDSQDYEFLVGLALKNFFEIKSKLPCVLALKLKDSSIQAISRNFDSHDVDTLAKYIKKYVDQHSDIDLLIAPGNIEQRQYRGLAVQVKRFGKGIKPEEAGTESLIRFIKEKVLSKYRDNDRIIVIVLETDEVIDLEAVRLEMIKCQPLVKRIMFISQIRSGNMVVGEFWPGEGYDEFDLEGLMRSV